LSCNSLQRTKYKIFEIKYGSIFISQAVKIFFRYLAKKIKKHIERTSIGKNSELFSLNYQLFLFLSQERKLSQSLHLRHETAYVDVCSG